MALARAGAETAVATATSTDITTTEELYAYVQRKVDHFMDAYDDLDVALTKLRRQLPHAVDEKGSPLWPGEGGTLRSPEGVRAAKRIIRAGREAQSWAKEAARSMQSMARTHRREVEAAMNNRKPTGPVFKAAS